MAEIDALSSLLFEESKRFLENAKAHSDPVGQTAGCHAALLVGFSALEAHLNAIAEELTLRRGLELIDQSILLEADIQLEGGKFVLNTSKLKMFRVEDRIAYIFANFTTTGVPTNEPWWGELKAGIDVRNRLVHPKQAIPIDAKMTARFLQAILECLDSLYLGAFKRHHPAYKRGLDSSLAF